MAGPRKRWKYRRYPGKCRSCKKSLGELRFGDCEECKAFRRRLDELHRQWGDRNHDPSGEKARRVEQYAALVAAQKRIFE